MASAEGKPATGSNEKASTQPEESSFDKLKKVVDLIKLKMAGGDMDDPDLLSALQQVYEIDVSDQRDNCDEIFKDVIDITSSLRDHLQYNAAILLIWVASKICETFTDPETKISKLDACGQSANITIMRMCMRNEKDDIKSNGLPIIEKLCVQVKSIETESTPLKAHVLCKCLSRVGSCNFYINNYEDAAKYCSIGLRVITSMLGDDAKLFVIAGATCYQAGESYRFMRKFDEAAELFEEAIEMYEGAQDVGEDEKRKCIDLSRDKLQKSRARQFP
ncbi:uncharacterized protein LOC143460884 isoform X2 [Clavelina lepadiformis]|uniref:uncharacterized protein LOC143460884 isoform X2 n=1 Tax=Clavelina lepadiformis TaxID=159417 RepID=UPI0040416490